MCLHHRIIHVISIWMCVFKLYIYKPLPACCASQRNGLWQTTKWSRNPFFLSEFLQVYTRIPHVYHRDRCIDTSKTYILPLLATETFFYQRVWGVRVCTLYIHARHLSASCRVIGEMESDRPRNEVKILIFIKNFHKYSYFTILSATLMHNFHRNILYQHGCACLHIAFIGLLRI